jgi:hypothetical protein
MAVRLAPASLYAHAPQTVLVPLNLFGVAEQLTALGLPWRRKSEFHVTAVDAGWLSEELDREPGEVWSATVAAIEGRRAGTVRLGSELRLAEEGEERTLLVMARVDGLGALYEELSRRLGAPLAPPPAHVTLYTRPEGKAIGLHDERELRRLTRPLDGEEAAAVAAEAGLGMLLAC